MEFIMPAERAADPPSRTRGSVSTKQPARHDLQMHPTASYPRERKYEPYRDPTIRVFRQSLRRLEHSHRVLDRSAFLARTKRKANGTKVHDGNTREPQSV